MVGWIALWVAGCGPDSTPAPAAPSPTTPAPSSPSTPTTPITTTASTGLTDADGDGALSDVDCDDANPDVFPDAPERCDGIDQDCNGVIDDDPIDPQELFIDRDGDGFGAVAVVECPWGVDRVRDGGDCDDAHPGVHPGAPIVCGDGLDNDCDGVIDPGCLRDPEPLAEVPTRIEGAEAGDRLRLVGHHGDAWAVARDDRAWVLPPPDGVLVAGDVGVPIDGTGGADQLRYGDVTGDGVADLVSGDPVLALFEGPFVQPRSAPTLTVPTAVDPQLVDLDGDGVHSVLCGDLSPWAPSTPVWTRVGLLSEPWTTTSACEDTSFDTLSFHAPLDHRPGDEFVVFDPFSGTMTGATVDEWGHRISWFDLYPEKPMTWLADVNGDGLADTSIAQDALMLYLGPLREPQDPAATILMADNHYPRWAGPAGDVDGDGTADLLVTTYHRGILHHHVLLGPLRPVMHQADAYRSWAGTAPGDIEASPVGDLDGDGYDDLVFSEPEATITAEGQGAVTLVHGGPR